MLFAKEKIHKNSSLVLFDSAHSNAKRNKLLHDEQHLVEAVISVCKRAMRMPSYTSNFSLRISF